MNDRTFEPLPDRLKDIWQTVAAIDASAIAHHHLQACQSQINGYCDEDDRFHDTIRFTHTLIPTILSS
jgi:hypothetical protein